MEENVKLFQIIHIPEAQLIYFSILKGTWPWTLNLTLSFSHEDSLQSIVTVGNWWDGLISSGIDAEEKDDGDLKEEYDY